MNLFSDDPAKGAGVSGEGGEFRGDLGGFARVDLLEDVERLA
jgi:hypothetical protein